MNDRLPVNEQAPAYRQGRSDSIPISDGRSHRHQLFLRPDIAGQSSFDCWGRLNAGVLAAPVVPSEIKPKHRVVIASLIAVSVR